MKNFRYSTGMKVLLVMLQQVFAVLLVVSIVLLSSLFDRQMLDTDNILNRSFVDSGYYAETFRQSVDELIKYAYLREQFEVQGSYNEEKAVDVFSYINGNNAVEKRLESEDTMEQKFRYHLGDLLNWAENGYKEDESGLLVETYTPISEKSIHRCMEEGILTYDEARYVTQVTEQVLDNIVRDMSLYKRYLNKYNVNETNVHYWISSGDEIPRITSNMTHAEVQRELENATEGVGSYFYYDAASLHMKTNID